ncbi:MULTISPECIES: hypothetical protein [unclassified Mesorhizobium]|uniref:hypothetical protein n=1 Tax=unclassified Mesorhizobium TaxID=325217 RepID=UPI000FD58860|nr:MULTISPECIES: hypothetical protein [unclassified Mesorhizobium]RUU98128.1 hypothetical protein EOA79_23805 [Mesorhizobium sp. M1A.F.Ca.IN.020.03.2.1]RWG87143.1 MAG: hypothetical protein EOQ70_14065 [Mesorhizobium sp.]RWK18219.1 MAG: hypothetical protein EOR41_13670 [Mesorhizobium sp.]
MKALTKSLLFAGTALVSLSAGSDAFADGCNCGTVRNIVQRAQENINAHTTDVGNQIAQTILKGVAQLSAYQNRAIEANARTQEAAQLSDTIRERQKARAAAEGGRYDPATSACLDLSGIFTMGKSGQDVAGYGGNDVANASRNWSYGNEDIGKPVIEGGLAVANAIVSDRDELRNVGGFADPTSDVRLLTDAITLDTSDEKIAKAQLRMINNMVDPIPPKPITQAELKAPAGRAQVAARQVDATRRSAAHAVYSYLGDIASPTGGQLLADWAKKAVTESYPYEVGEHVSELQAVDIFVRSRFANPEWHQELAGMSPEAVQREQLLAQALNLHVDWMRFNLERRQAAAIAALLSNSLDERDSRTTITTVNAQ